MQKIYGEWHDFLSHQVDSKNISNEIKEIKEINKQLLEELETCAAAENSQEELYERFYKDIEFGTGGLRGILGAGTNRMNIYTVARATGGIADYIHENKEVIEKSIGEAANEKKDKEEPAKDKQDRDKPAKNKEENIDEKENESNPRVAIAYDSRINSKIFAETAAHVMRCRGIDVYLYEELMPTPALSFAVRYFGCHMGIMITASHNPAKYNGYKVYNHEGCQVTVAAAEEIYKLIGQQPIFDTFDTEENGRGLSGNIHNCMKSGKELLGKLHIIGKDTKEEYLKAVQKESTIRNEKDRKALEKLCVVYTPLNGAGNKPVREILEKIGVKNVHTVKEQELPDGNFPTCPYPNPEKKEALELGLNLCMKLADRAQASGDIKNIPDLLLATDPDCDRVGIAVGQKKEGRTEYILLNGNQTGILLLDYLITMKVKSGIKKTPMVVKTIVTTKMADALAAKHGIKVVTTLTGFKFIGEQIGILEKEGREENYLFGFEESYGYLSGTYVRDKDAVNGVMLICEMAAYYKSKGQTLADRMEELYREYGYYNDTLIDFTFEGAKGMETMQKIMKVFRYDMKKTIAGKKIIEMTDYLLQQKRCLNGGDCGFMSAGTKPVGLPKSDVVEYVTEDGDSFTVRPSGTEPKIKIYLSAKGETLKESVEITEKLKLELSEIVKSQ